MQSRSGVAKLSEFQPILMLPYFYRVYNTFTMYHPLRKWHGLWKMMNFELKPVSDTQLPSHHMYDLKEIFTTSIKEEWLIWKDGRDGMIMYICMQTLPSTVSDPHPGLKAWESTFLYLLFKVKEQSSILTAAANRTISSQYRMWTIKLKDIKVIIQFLIYWLVYPSYLMLPRSKDWWGRFLYRQLLRECSCKKWQDRAGEEVSK